MDSFVEILQSVVGIPMNEWQENALFVGAICFLFLTFWAIFKIVNYLFHI